MIRFSLIVPTRHRTDGLRRLLDSLAATARNPQQIEVIAVIDADDAESIAFSYADLAYHPVIVSPGRTMGELDLSGYRQATGEYLMLLNDDVVVRSSGWDTELERVLAAWPDGVVLAHVNDLLFRDTLCIFPCVSRAFCELAGGICHPGYHRYRIDDHLHNIFDLVHLLGYTRRVFLPQVVFEHTSTAGHYNPDEAILETDNRQFEELLPQRRKIALDCVERIEGRSRPSDRAVRAQFLEGFSDSIALRRREYAVWWPRTVAPQGPALVVQPSRSTRIISGLWEILARLSAQLPPLARLGLGLPPGIFDAAWYLSRYPEVAAKGEQPLTHYLRTGAFRGYNPSPNFDTNWYLATNPDVAASGLNPLVHFALFGAREKRSPKPLADGPASSAPVLVEAPAPISVLIPTHNRRASLLRTLQACNRHRAGCELEFVVIDDGSTDDTAALLRELAPSMPDLRWQSQPAAGPARARNLAASLARYDVLLFLGDDIVPANDGFFRTHALRHAQRPEPDFAVLGKLDWPDEPDFPVNFPMRQIHEDGSQFAYSRLIPGSFAGWQFFYSSNVSIKKSLVSDWLTGGFDAGFPGAAFEDIELAYRLFRSHPALRLYYDPASLGMHYHAYTVETFMARQYRAGCSLRYLLALHPELTDEYNVGRIDAALRQPARTGDGETDRRVAATIDSLKEEARSLESRGLLGTDKWHGQFLSTLFRLCLEDGYASSYPEGNLAAARNLMLDRRISPIRRLA